MTMRSQETFVGLFFGSLPEFEDLEAVLANVEPENGREISTIQPLCCRELIFTETKILCSPSLGDKTQLLIIGQKSIFNSQQFQRLLNKLGIKITQSVDLSRNLFQYCLYFTINQRLAPLWNKVGEYYVKGRDFLLDSSKMDAVTFDVTLKDNICFGLKAFNLKLPPCKVEHFSASSKALEYFHETVSAVIDGAAIHTDACLVLPSLKKGRLLSISHHLPQEGPFATYEELRKHWKVMYGYRLPAKETIFYNVSFYYFNSNLFTYPGSCIRSREPVVSPRCDQQAIFNAFLKDLHIRVPSICGTPLRLASAPLYPVKTLHNATSENQSNLTRATPLMPHCRPFESLPGSQTVAEDVTNGHSLLMDSDATQEHSDVVSGNGAITAQESPVSRSVTSMTAPNAHPQSTRDSVSRPRLVPHFTASRRLKCNDFQSSESEVIRPAIPRPILSFGARKNALPSCNNKEPNKGKRNTPDQNRGGSVSPLSVDSSAHHAHSCVVNNAEGTATMPVPQRATGRGRPQTGGKAEMVEFQRSRFVGTPVAPPKSSVESVKIAHRNPSLVAKQLPATRPGFAWAVNSNCPGAMSVLASQRDGTMKKYTDPRFPPHHAVPSPSLAGTPNTSNHDRSSSFSPVERQANAMAEMVCGRKRKVEETTGAEALKNKKPKSKPKVQDLDIKELAYSNQLNKANTATLIDWLRKHDVAVKSKDKKGELVDKIKQFLGLNQHDLATTHHP